MTPSTPRPYTMWCFGISEHDLACIRRCAGEECLVTVQNDAALRDEVLMLREEPTLLWVHAEAWDRMDMGHVGGSARAVPKVMILDAARDLGDLDHFIEADAEHVLRGPLTPDGVYRIMRRTLEVCTIHSDMGRMTREILLNREMLARKTDVLSFLFEAEETLLAARGVPAILCAARAVLARMLPLHSLHAVLWQPGSNNDVEIYLDGLDPEGAAGKTWRHMLLDAAGRLTSGMHSVRRVERLLGGPELPPHAGHVLLLPLAAAGAPVGALMLLQSRDMTCSRDQSLALNAVLARIACLIRLADMPLVQPGQAAAPSFNHADTSHVLNQAGPVSARQTGR